MVQGEKQSGLIMSFGATGRTNDPSARKAGYDAVSSGSSTSSSSFKGQQQQAQGSSSSNVSGGQYGSWGPMFKNKSNFAEMHWC